MLSVAEAVARVTAVFAPVEAENVSIAGAAGRVLAQDAIAQLDQPPAPVSAMDGYAVRASNTASVPATFHVIGASPAGHPFSGTVGAGQAVRIFTGGVVPDGADAIVIQEDTEIIADRVIVREATKSGRHVRPAGLDFKKGDVLARAGRRLTARDVALLAAADIANLSVRRRPRIAFAATGDELSRPGEPRAPGGIVASSGYGLSALIERWGGEPRDLGILPDTMEAISRIAEAGKDADIIVTLGGASVGDHDLIQRALGPKGFALDFWKIAMRPGKPLIFGRLGTTPLLGLPGNPVSTFVCALLFLKPAIGALLGAEADTSIHRAKLVRDLPANDSRQDYLRATLSMRDGEVWAEPLPIQDSSMLRALAQADGLIVRAPHADSLKAGEPVVVLPLASC